MNKNQEQNLKRQIATLRLKNKEYDSGLKELSMSCDAVMIRLAQTFGEEREGGYRLEMNVPDINDNIKYEVKSERQDGKYVIGVFERVSD